MSNDNAIRMSTVSVFEQYEKGYIKGAQTFCSYRPQNGHDCVEVTWLI